MKEKEFDVSTLEKILDKTINAIDKSKQQIFEIAEDARTEKQKIIDRLQRLDVEIQNIISEVDKLEEHFTKTRKELVVVSKNFSHYTEHDIQKAYEEANKTQVALLIAREKEINLKTRRNDLQVRLRSIELTIERAESLITQVSVVFDYLSNDAIKITELVESVKLSQMLGLKIIQAQEEERKRVARDIHDGPAQSMANVVLRTEIAERLVNNNQFDFAIRELKDLKTMVRSSLADVRQIIFDLRPMALDDLGLLPTLRKYIPEIAKREQLHIDLTFKGKDIRLSTSMEVAIFRLVQELINNVIKHAKATQVETCIEYAEKYIEVIIKDNGVGFIEEEVLKNKNKFGLLGMKERIQLLEGEFFIQSAKNNGTKVTFKIPLNESEEINDESKQ